jgi:hypothetical protein
MIPLAHVGHLLIDIPLFMGPVVVLVIALVWSTRAERRRQHGRPGGSASA